MVIANSGGVKSLLQDAVEKMTAYINKNNKRFCSNVIRKSVIIREVSFTVSGVEVFYQDETRLMTQTFPWQQFNRWLQENENNGKSKEDI